MEQIPHLNTAKVAVNFSCYSCILCYKQEVLYYIFSGENNLFMEKHEMLSTNTCMTNIRPVMTQESVRNLTGIICRPS